MQRAHLSIRIASAEGALLRALGTLVRRGWDVRRLEVHPESDAHQRVDAQVTSHRRSPTAPLELHTLRRQLLRLVEVESVELSSSDGNVESRRESSTPLPRAVVPLAHPLGKRPC